MTILYNPFQSGQGISINYNNGTINNTGVLSLDSDTGNLSLSAGTGISISGLTITNTGVDSLVAGTGISISGSTGSVTVTNAGVTSLQGDTGALSLSAGTGISISGLTISNSGVTSFQGDTGSITLTAGTGIGISGLTISNAGVTSLTGGTGIIVSASTGSITITNSGIIGLSAGDGITVSGSTISMSGSYSGNYNISQALTLSSGQQNYGLQIGNSAWGSANYGKVFYPDIELWRDDSNTFGVVILEGFTEGIFALANRGTSTVTSNTYGGSGLGSGYVVYPLTITTSGAVYTSGTTNNTTTSNTNPVPRNTLDDGSGDEIITGNQGIKLDNNSYANYFWLQSEGVVAFFGNEYSTPIIDVGVNVTQQTANSNGLPSPNTSYGGGLFRFDLRSTNSSGLTGLSSSPQWYILLQDSGTAGGGTPYFGVDSGGRISGVRNVFDNGSGGFSFAGGGTIDGSLTLDGKLQFKTPASGIIAYSNLGAFEGTITSDFSANYPIGVVTLDAGYTFTNETGGTIFLIYAATDGSSIGGAGSTTGTFYYLSPSSGTDAVVHMAGMTQGSSVVYNSFNITYAWFLMS